MTWKLVDSYESNERDYNVYECTDCGSTVTVPDGADVPDCMTCEGMDCSY